MTRRIILAGGGHAHLAVLADWAKAPPPGTERWLVTANRHTAYSGMLPGWMAGIYRAEELLIDLAPLAEAAGVRLVLDKVTGLDAASHLLKLERGDVLTFDLLSLATGGEADLSSLAELGARVIAVRPVDHFMQRWSAAIERLDKREPFVLVVVGGGAAGVELALAACAALQHHAARIVLVTPRDDFLRGHAKAVRRRVMAELARRGIVVEYAQAVGDSRGLLLSDGTTLAADLVLAATGSRPPRWLAQSGLACTPDGFAAVGANLRSISHEAIFAAGDIVQRIDRPLPRSGVHAVKAGPVLATNLRASLQGQELVTYQPRNRTLYLMATGERRAIGSWGGLAFSGRMVWWLKDWIDRHFVLRYRRSQAPTDRR